MEKTCLGKKCHYTGRANSSYVSYKTWRPVYMRNKKLDSPFFGGRVTLLAGPTFLHINTLIHPAGSTRSRRDNQSMREHCCQLLAQAKGSFFLSYKHSLSWLGWENVPLSRDNFSLYKRVLKLYLHCIIIKRRQRGWAVIALDLLSGSPQNAIIK